MEYITLPRHQIRRSDREVTDEDWMSAFLHRAPAGYLATVDGDQPYINVNLFAYDAERHAIYLHTARKGRTRANLENSSPVCFTVSEMGRLLPAEVALEFSVEYQSVTVFGRAAVVTDEAEAIRALQLLLDKYFPHLAPGRDYRPPVPEELKRTTVFALAIEDWSGKRKQVAEDFPGAVFYPSAENGYRPV
jgi:nitroimidazol reductase NimA-like FMN-containing flavoprotein (pyridoxamine 5'-phosphate oxidase superfamily)